MLNGKVNKFRVKISHLLSFQSIFDELPQKEMEEARAKSNVYETIGSSIFLNRYINKMNSYNNQFYF